jgi:hypothetical protein
MWMYVLHMLASTPYISGLFMGGIQLDLHHQRINFDLPPEAVPVIMLVLPRVGRLV